MKDSAITLKPPENQAWGKSTISERATNRLLTFPEKSYIEVEETMDDLGVRDKGVVMLNHLYFTLGLSVLTIASLTLQFVALMVARLYNDNLDEARWYIITDYVIVAIFVAETVTRCGFMGIKNYFRSPMCVADFVVTAIDVLVVILLAMPSSPDDLATIKPVIRMLRVLRISKLTRISRLATQVDEISDGHRGTSVTRDDYGRIFEYNSATLFSVGWLTNLKGTVLAMPQIWVQLIFLVIITTYVASFTCKIDCDPFRGGPGDPMPEDCTDTDDVCFGSMDPSYSLMFMGLAAFLLGIFAQMLFDRWWYMRTQIQALFEECKNISMMCTSFLNVQDDKRTQSMQKDMMRWSKLGLFLLEKQIDGKTNYREAVEKGMLTEAEWDILEKYPANNYALPLQWGFDTVCRAHMENRILEFGGGGMVDDFASKFLAQRALGAEILMYLDTPMPYIFAHLMTLICKINFFLTAVASGTVVGQAIQTHQYLVILMGYFTVIFGNLLIEGLLRLHVVLSDPFGDDDCDFPWEMMMDDLLTEAAMIEGQGKLLPYAQEFVPFVSELPHGQAVVDDKKEPEPPTAMLPPISSSRQNSRNGAPPDGTLAPVSARGSRRSPRQPSSPDDRPLLDKKTDRADRPRSASISIKKQVPVLAMVNVPERSTPAIPQ